MSEYVPGGVVPGVQSIILRPEDGPIVKVGPKIRVPVSIFDECLACGEPIDDGLAYLIGGHSARHQVCPAESATR